MSNLSVFSFNSNDVRTFADAKGEPWFCAKDICAVLGYANDTQAIQKNCKERGVSKRDTLTNGGMQSLSYINEGNLYRLIIKSRKPEAEAFEEHVMEVILPTIRKTGTYSAPERKTKQQPQDEEKTASLITRMIHNLVASQVKQVTDLLVELNHHNQQVMANFVNQQANRFN